MWTAAAVGSKRRGGRCGMEDEEEPEPGAEDEDEGEGAEVEGAEESAEV